MNAKLPIAWAAWATLLLAGSIAAYRLAGKEGPVVESPSLAFVRDQDRFDGTTLDVELRLDPASDRPVRGHVEVDGSGGAAVRVDDPGPTIAAGQTRTTIHLTRDPGSPEAETTVELTLASVENANPGKPDRIRIVLPRRPKVTEDPTDNGPPPPPVAEVEVRFAAPNVGLGSGEGNEMVAVLGTARREDVALRFKVVKGSADPVEGTLKIPGGQHEGRVRIQPKEEGSGGDGRVEVRVEPSAGARLTPSGGLIGFDVTAPRLSGRLAVILLPSADLARDPASVVEGLDPLLAPERADLLVGKSLYVFDGRALRRWDDPRRTRPPEFRPMASFDAAADAALAESRRKFGDGRAGGKHAVFLVWISPLRRPSAPAAGRRPNEYLIWLGRAPEGNDELLEAFPDVASGARYFVFANPRDPEIANLILQIVNDTIPEGAEMASTAGTTGDPPVDDVPSGRELRARAGLVYGLAYLPGLLAGVVQVALLALLFQHWASLRRFEADNANQARERFVDEARIVGDLSRALGALAQVYGETNEKIERAQAQLKEFDGRIPTIVTAVNGLAAKVNQSDKALGQVKEAARQAMKEELSPIREAFLADLNNANEAKVAPRIAAFAAVLDDVRKELGQVRQEVGRQSRREDVAIVAFHTERELNQQAYGPAFRSLFNGLLPLNRAASQRVALFQGQGGEIIPLAGFDRDQAAAVEARFDPPDGSASESVAQLDPEKVFKAGDPKAIRHCILLVGASAVAPPMTDPRWQRPQKIRVDVVRIAQPPPRPAAPSRPATPEANRGGTPPARRDGPASNPPPRPAPAPAPRPASAEEAQVRDGWDQFCGAHEGFVVNLTARKGPVEGKPPVEEDPTFVDEVKSVLYRLIQPFPPAEAK